MTAKILVTGVTGTTGGEVARQLVAAGHNVRVLVRSSEAAKQLPLKGVETAIGHYDDVASLAAAFAGIEAAFAVTPVSASAVDWMRNLIDAAKRAEVSRARVPRPAWPRSRPRPRGTRDSGARARARA